MTYQHNLVLQKENLIPYYKAEVSNGISFRILGDNFTSALKIIKYLEFFPFIKHDDGIVETPSITLNRKPLPDCLGEEMLITPESDMVVEDEKID